MKLSHRLALGATSFGLLAAVTVPVFAATSNNRTQRADHRQALIQALVQRFNLNQADVNQFFEEQGQKQFADMLVRIEERLTAEVKAGRLTEAQKVAIVAKAKEMQPKLEALKTLTPEERKQKMEAIRTELEVWVTQNNIPKQYLQILNGHHGGFGHMKSRMGKDKGKGMMQKGPRGGRGMFGPMNGQVPPAQNQ